MFDVGCAPFYDLRYLHYSGDLYIVVVTFDIPVPCLQNQQF